MWFKKKKLPATQVSEYTTDFRDTTSEQKQQLIERYTAIKKRNTWFSIIATLFISMLAGYVSFTVFALASGQKVNFPSIRLPASFGIPFVDTEAVGGKKNILLTGIGWFGHDGTFLTDTIILASVDFDANIVTMLSLPRDLYVEFTLSGKKWRGRINEVHARALAGKQKPTKDEYAIAMQALSEKVTEITGEPVDAYLRIDFAGFSKFVNALWGVEVDNPSAILDREYPDNNWGYQTFRLPAGKQTLDGATALKFVRSRHSTSDFDRSLRQQLVIAAIKDKLFSLDALTSPTKLQWLYSSVADNVFTSLSMTEIAELALFSKDLPRDHIMSYTINDACFQGAYYCQAGGFLYTPNRELFNGMAVLLANTSTVNDISDYSDIREFTNTIFNYPEPIGEKNLVAIINTTKQTGLANKLALSLTRFGFVVPEKDGIWSVKEPMDSSVIYYLSKAEVPGIWLEENDPTLQSLKSLTGFPIVWTGSLMYPKIDTPIQIFLGSDSKLLPPFLVR
jgi:LCP family protein required for cell wall assembly